ncbi:hypothetical protein PVAP13_9NG466914 [Panicum virgatum]|uniref:DUF7597 domain-containing protein n=1 Tax=Panicum virgatum TaxID=38727 RepID=A0A8T0MX48_PANVG|nr:hypothetical protein PVAP13_9NG466914 [Panicum virgatum]
MAFRLVDPSPFIPRGFQCVQIEGRKLMSRVHVSFLGIRHVLEDFLRDEKGISFHSIQPCPFGQAYVRFNFFHDRDALIHGSPHTFGDIRVSFAPHNDGWNLRSVTFNHEVWLMFLEKALADFGKLVAWEEDPNNLARVLVKARVINLEEIPWFMVCSDGEGFEGESWSCQCEIIQTRMLGQQPQDEDIPPDNNDDFNPGLFDFFGYGQPGNAPPPPHDPANAPNAPAAAEWGLWPDNGQDNEDEVNGPVDPAEAANLVQVPIQGEPFLELNDLVNQNDGNVGGVDLDLNQPLDDELGGIEDLIQAVDAMEEEMAQVQEEQTILDDQSDNSEGNLADHPLLNLNNDIEVNVFIPMDGDVPLQLIPDEIHEDELLGDPLPNPNQPQIDVIDNGNMQLGFVETFFPVVDPAFASAQNTMQAASSELIRQWARNFAPGPGDPTIQIPLPFALPHNCPTKTASSCMKDSINFDLFEDLISQNDNTTEAAKSTEHKSPSPVKSPPDQQHLGPWSKAILAQTGKLKLIADDPGLRRSARRKNINKGYKDPSCLEKDCVACSVKPPTICANLSDEALLKKKKASAPGGKKLKKPQDKNDDASKPDKKKSRK